MKDFKVADIIPAIFDEKEEQLAEFVHTEHEPQKRKYSEGPYACHLVNVAQAVKDATNDPVLTAAALAHDLFEDTECDEGKLKSKLLEIGFSAGQAKRVVQYVWDLTDRFIKKEYPRLNRRQRKAKEAERIGTIHAGAKSVKLADLYDNLSDRILDDADFAAVYLREAQQMLPHLEVGNTYLFQRLQYLMAEVEKKLSGVKAG